MFFAGWEVRIVKSCDQGLKNAARGRSAEGSIFKAECDKLACKWVYATLSLNWPGLLAVKNLTSERASNLDTRQRKIY